MKNILSIVMLMVWISGATCSATELTVNLKDAVVVRSTQVLLRDVASLSGTDATKRRAAELTELRMLDPISLSATITATSVRTRLVLAGWKLSDVNITGSPQVLVEFREPQLMTDTLIEAEAHRVMCEARNADQKDLTVRLRNAFVQSLPMNIRDTHELTVKVLPPDKALLGAVTMTVQLWSGETMVMNRSAIFEVRRKHRVAIARVSLTRDAALDNTTVQFEERFLPAEADELSPELLEGRTVRSNIVAGSILQLRDLHATTTGRKPIVHRGENVHVFALAGRLRTVLRNAEALQDGGHGDMIELKNKETSATIVGRVIGPGQVLVRIR